MSEEKPTFKVTDRRLFNADGTPRGDIPREEEKPPAAEAQPAAAAAEPAAPAGEAGQGASARAASAADTDELYAALDAEEAARSASGAEGEGHQRGASARAGGAESADPTPFANLVMFIAQPAAAAMGMTEHPGLAPGEVDLPLAKHCIDLLATVREKTRGNLGQQEQQILEGLLAELRMQYVSLTSAPRPAPPRGFSGSDITGGR